MNKPFFLAGLLYISMSCAFAQPEKLDVVGLVPGEATVGDISKIKTRLGRYLIGGYHLNCDADFVSQKLAELFCKTDLAFLMENDGSGRGREVSNIEVHQTLLEGYRNKFGNPKIEIENVQTRIGSHQKREIATWMDKLGNRLILMSMTNNLNQGILLLQSAEKISADEVREKNQNKSRAF
jgi:hypothetical protein